MIIENFSLISQQRNNTCGYATASMILSSLEGKKISEDYLVENDPFDVIGITFTKLMEVYKKYLERHSAEIIYGDREKMLSIIKDSLKENRPLHILYLTENLRGNNEPVLHYAALIGCNDEPGKFIIADPYGSIKSLGAEAFWSSISFRNECLPDIVKQKYPSNMMIRFVEI